MGDLFFFFKCLIMTSVLVLLLQIRIGDSTLEEKATRTLGNSFIIDQLETVAAGGVVLIRNSWNRLTSSINTRFKHSVSQDQVPGSRELAVQLSRSQRFLKEQAAKVEDLARPAEDRAAKESETEASSH